MPVSFEDELLTVDQAAQWLKVTRKTLYNWRKEGILAPIIIGKNSVRYRLSDLKAYIERGQTNETVGKEPT